jgi:hypothetical protein
MLLVSSSSVIAYSTIKTINRYLDERFLIRLLDTFRS